MEDEEKKEFLINCLKERLVVLDALISLQGVRFDTPYLAEWNDVTTLLFDLEE